MKPASEVLKQLEKKGKKISSKKYAALKLRQFIQELGDFKYVVLIALILLFTLMVAYRLSEETLVIYLVTMTMGYFIYLYETAKENISI